MHKRWENRKKMRMKILLITYSFARKKMLYYIFLFIERGETTTAASEIGVHCCVLNWWFIIQYFILKLACKKENTSKHLIMSRDGRSYSGRGRAWRENVLFFLNNRKEYEMYRTIQETGALRENFLFDNVGSPRVGIFSFEPK